MIYGFFAFITVFTHLLFILYASLGGLLVFKWPKSFILHISALFWGIYIELSHGICPLTPLENYFRIKAGGQGYSGDFIEQYLLKIIYPGGLTDNIQLFLGMGLLVINLVIYGIVIRKKIGRTD